MHLTIAIPTFNRCNYLKKNIEYFDKLLRPDDVRISLTISNSASVDNTSEFLQSLQTMRDDLNIFNRKTDWTGGNYGYLADTVPGDADWVWFMGDDDYIPDPNALHSLCNLLREKTDDPNFGFVHVCQAKRSRNTGKITTDTTFNLCNLYGYTEMLGWISSIVIRRKQFVAALKKTDARAQLARKEAAHENSHSSFFQAAYIFEEIFWMMGSFIDSPLVETQEQGMTEATRDRWERENMGERYIYIMDDIERLKNNGLPLSRLSPQFFRYHRYQLWDRFIIYQLGLIETYGDGKRDMQTDSSMSRFVKNWERISSITSYLDESVTKKLLICATENGLGLCNLYLETGFNSAVRELIKRQRDLHTIHTYDFAIEYK